MKSAGSLWQNVFLLSPPRRRARGFQGEMAGGPYQGHACRVPHHVLRGHRATFVEALLLSENLPRYHPLFLSLPFSLFFSSLPLLPALSFLSPSGLESNSNTNAATLSHSQFSLRLSPFSGASLLSPLFSFIRREVFVLFSLSLSFSLSRSLVPLWPSQLVRLRSSARFRLPRLDVARMHESKGGGAHACVGTWLGMREEKRAARTYGSAEPARGRSFFHRSANSVSVGGKRAALGSVVALENEGATTRGRRE